jgi:hypothetical protein
MRDFFLSVRMICFGFILRRSQHKLSAYCYEAKLVLKFSSGVRSSNVKSGIHSTEKNHF